MTQTITGMFDRYDDARRAVQDLEAAGVPHRDISIVGHDKHGAHGDAADAAADDAGKGAGIGAAVGGVGGLLAGLGLLAIPGIGPVVAAGWLAATAAGAAGGALVGAAAGGLVGALTEAGVPEDVTRMSMPKASVAAARWSPPRSTSRWCRPRAPS